MNRRFRLAVFGLLTLFLVPLSVKGQVALEIDQRIDQTKVDLNLWNQTVVPVHDRLTFSLATPTLKIAWGNPHDPATPDTCGVIHINSYPSNRSDLGDNFYRVLTHVYSHAKFTCLLISLGLSAPNLLFEGLAEAERHLTYQHLHLPGIRETTDLLDGPFLDNMSSSIGGGGSTYRDSLTLYRSPSARLELLADRAGGSFNSFYQLVEQLRPQNDQEYLMLLDHMVASIDGVKPSTYLDKSPVTFLHGPDGPVLGVEANSAINDDRFKGATSPINPDSILVYYFTRDRGAIKVFPDTPVTFHLRVQNSDGTIILDRDETLSSYAVYPFAPPEFRTLSDGAYKVTATTAIPALQATNYFLVHHAAWDSTNDLFVIANGPEFKDLTAFASLETQNLPAGVVQESFLSSGYLHFRLNGASPDITIKAGTRTRTFSTHSALPRIVLFADRDQPFVYSATNGATFRPSPIAPGSIESLWTWGATQTDQEWPASLPLPTSSCQGGQGATKVAFTGSDGVRLEAPYFYCSRQQLNVQVPSRLAGPKAQVEVMLNSSSSNLLIVDVADADPGIFEISLGDDGLMGAVLHNAEGYEGQLVTPSNPAFPGEVLTVYATGLGTVECKLEGGEPFPPPADGQPAPQPPILCTTVLPVTAELEGESLQVLFAGLAPGYVGLYQMNVRVPEETGRTLTQPMLIRVGGAVSKTVMLSLRK